MTDDEIRELRIKAFETLRAQIPLMDYLDLVDLYGLVLGELQERNIHRGQ